jgi:hypothetical protein
MVDFANFRAMKIETSSTLMFFHAFDPFLPRGNPLAMAKSSSAISTERL